MLLPFLTSQNQKVFYTPDNHPTIELWIKREDLLHPHISGNKYRKLRYNIQQAYVDGKETLLTFGGAFSNHIAATAAAGFELGFKTIGIIRGDELANKENLLDENPTLKFASRKGMKFKFVSRSDYRMRETKVFQNELKNEFGDFYLVPQGGTNYLAIKGCEEILTDEDDKFHYICCAIGNGGTISGLINKGKSNQIILGFPASKDDSLIDEIQKYTQLNNNWTLIKDYHFGGFAKINNQLIEFMNDFKQQTGIALDPVYTGKMFFGIIDLCKNGYFPSNSKILAVHTGGLQGVEGMNHSVLKNKSLKLI